MVANWVKAVWILIGGTVAAAGAAYVGGVFEPSPGSAPIEAAIQQPPAGQTGQGKDAPATAETGSHTPADGDTADAGGEQVASLPPAGDEPEASGQAPAAPAATETAPEPQIVVPAFDLVRVEPDGSVVIAGTAEPNAMVEVIAGATVIGTANAGPSGDFAVVLDDPLEPGDYTVVLRSTSGENLVATSSQTAVIAVPDGDSGQVLALVEEPGAPSRLITVPEAPQPKPQVASGEQAPAQEEKVAAKGDRPAAAPAAGPEAGTQVASDEPAADAPLAGDVGKESEAAPAEEQQMADAAEPQPQPAEPAAKPKVAPRVAVEAVEIEGRKVFVAGRAEAGTTVRVYANDILLGQAVVSEGGRFLIETERDLPVGDYIVRADMLNGDKSEVVARAAVPFEREPGENLAAVAAPQPADPARPAVQQPGAAGQTGDGETAAAQDTAAATPPADEAPAQQMASADAQSGSADAAGASQSAELAGSDTDTPAGAGEAAGDAQEMASADAAPVEATAPKLQNVGGAVIIRRGDTLWRLSRRVYGRGVRYTTIYLANQEQIADPDMIWPGQVFSVPSETDEGEAADMSAVAEQVADPDGASEDVATR